MIPESIYGGNPAANKAARDTVVLIGPWGSGATINGQFQNQQGTPDWNGWTHHDVTEITETSGRSATTRQISGAEALSRNQALWCGDADYAACDEEDLAGGYGNSWDEFLPGTARFSIPPNRRRFS